LNDNRRYLDYSSIRKILGDEDLAVTTIDSWIAKNILYRGFIFKCGRCSYAAWFAVDSITQTFTCPRCGTSQQYTHSHWLRPTEPSWFYKLDEIVYQMLAHNGDVALLTLLALQKQSRGSFLYSPELSIQPDDEFKGNMEIDICCILDGKIIIGEAKSTDSLASNKQNAQQVVNRYRILAEKMRASALMFSTTEEAWETSTSAAIDNLVEQVPFLKVYRYLKSQL
jgi:hypothetical protein